MIIFIIFAISGYLFFKYMLPLLKNPENKPTELYQFYGKHPKLFVLTIILALFGAGQFFNEIFSFIVGFIFVPCYDNPNGGMITIMCAMKNSLGFGT